MTASSSSLTPFTLSIYIFLFQSLRTSGIPADPRHNLVLSAKHRQVCDQPQLTQLPKAESLRSQSWWVVREPKPQPPTPLDYPLSSPPPHLQIPFLKKPSHFLLYLQLLLAFVFFSGECLCSAGCFHCLSKSNS